MQFCFVDRVTEWEKGQYIQGYKNISVNHADMQAHFPAYPVFPGTQMIEAMAQLAGFLLEHSFTVDDGSDTAKRALLVKISNARFQHLVVPGDRLDMRVEVQSEFGDAISVQGQATVNDTVAVQAELAFLLKSIDIAAIHARQRTLYRLWTRQLEQNP